MSSSIRHRLVALLPFVLGIGCSTPAPVCPTTEEPAPHTPTDRAATLEQTQAAFDFLVSLEGEWTAHQNGAGSDASFKLIGGYSAVMQQTGFTAIYHIDGDNLKMLLFPDDGYQATMRSKGFEKVGDGPQVRFVFDFASATNMPSQARRPRRVIFTRSDDDRIMQTWTWFDHGREVSQTISLTRKKADAAPAPVPAPAPTQRSGG